MNLTFQSPPVNMSVYMKQQREQRGLAPLPLEPELLIQRIKQGGQSGQFLAEAFLSAYRPGRPFRPGLYEIVKLDSEGFRLFHQILHMRHSPGWDDNALYEIEQKLISILTGDAK